MKKSRGFTLIEVILILFLNVMIALLITMSFNVFMKINNNNSSPHLISAYESLMYIDYYINHVGEKFNVEGNRIYILSEDGQKCDYIQQRGNEIGIFFMNKQQGDETTISYTYQPILYEVKDLNIEENNKVILIKITMQAGVEAKKTIGKL